MSSRTLRITRSVIVVSPNSKMERGVAVDHKVWGILPGARDSKLLTTMPAYLCIVVRPLMGSSNGSASIHPDDWRNLVEESPVVSSDLFPIELTLELELFAWKQCLEICDCPAVRRATEIAESYKTSQRWDSMVRRAQ